MKKLLCLEGKLSQKDGNVSVVCDNILSETQWEQRIAGMRLCCKLEDGDTARMQQILHVANRFPGDTPLCFWLNGSRRYLMPKHGHGIAISTPMLRALCDTIIPLQYCALIPPAKLK